MSTIRTPKLIIAKIRFDSTVVTSTYGVTSSIYFGYPDSFEVYLDIDPQFHSDPNTTTPFTFDSNDIEVGDWFGLTSGKIYRIKSIVQVVNDLEIRVVIEDKDLFNLLSDYAQLGNNLPEEDQFGAIVQIGDDGLPIYNPITIQSGLLPFTTYWITDLVSRFRFRNYLKDYYQNDPDDTSYVGLTAGDFVYLDETGKFQKITDANKSTTLEKAFGVITYVESDPGRISVRPFGRIVDQLPNLPGPTGGVVYFDPLSQNNLTGTKPSDHILPTYIKINNNKGLLLSKGGSSNSGVTGPTGSQGFQGHQGFQGFQGPSQTNAVTGTGSPTQVAFWNSSSTLSGDSGLYWDNSNKRLSVGTSSTTYRLNVNGGVYQQTYYTDTNSANFRMGSSYELYGVTHSLGGYEYYLTNNFGWGAGWTLNFGTNANKILTISDTYIESNQLFTFNSGWRISSGILSSYSSSPNTGLTYFDVGGWNFVLRGSSGINRFILSNTGSVTIHSLTGSGTRMVVSDSNGTLSTQVIPSGTITGSGTSNYITKWSSSTGLTDSQIFDNGTKIDFLNSTRPVLSVLNTGLSVNSISALNDADSYNIKLNAIGSSGNSQSADIFLDGSGASSGSALRIRNNNGSINLIPSSNDINLEATNPQLYATSGGIRFTNNSASSGFIFGNYSTQTSGSLFQVINNYLNIPASYPLTIFANGNVLLGTASQTDAGYKLDVAGTSRLNGVVTVNSLSGSGSRMVVADSGGVLSTQAIPSGNTNSVAKFGTISSLTSSNISDNGTIVSISTDATINSMRIGRGPGNITSNITLGQDALASNLTGNNNVAIGASALFLNNSNNNTAIGAESLINNTGSDNTAIGRQSLYANTTGVSNTGIGRTTLASNTTGNYNVAIGQSALFWTANSSQNVAIGYFALINAGRYSGASDNIGIGVNAGRGLSAGSFNTIIGRLSYGDNSINPTASNNNTAIGYRTGYLNKGSGNVFIGNDAGYNETGSNKLYISNSNTSTPLIFGDFASQSVVINRTLTVSSAGSTGSLLNVTNNSGSIFNISSPGVVYINSASQSGLTSSTVIIDIDRTSGSACYFDYVVGDAINNAYRSGTIMAVWNSSNVQFNDTSTNDLGNSTAGIVMNVSMFSSTFIRLTANITSGTWSVKVAVRLI